MSNSKARSFCLEQPFAIGGHVKKAVLNMAGPTSYDSTNKDVIPASVFGLGANAKILQAQAGTTNSGTYSIRTIYSSEGGATSIKLVWTVIATGVEVANGVDLSAERYRLIGELVQ